VHRATYLATENPIVLRLAELHALLHIFSLFTIDYMFIIGFSCIVFFGCDLLRLWLWSLYLALLPWWSRGRQEAGR
jgi:hypothetical protein